MRIAREEIFGPVLSVLRVKDFDEAMRVANDCDYGLSSSIFSNDAVRIFRFVDEIETGMTHINSPTTGGEAHIPFGGIKGTGIGDREQGSTALDFYTDLKVVTWTTPAGSVKAIYTEQRAELSFHFMKLVTSAGRNN